MTAREASPLIEFEMASSYRRLVARLIDLAICFLVFPMVAGMVAYPLSALFKLAEDVGTWSFVVIVFLCIIAYDTVMLHLLGKTVGKMALGLRVVDIKGERLGWGMCLVRAIVLYLCGIGIAFLTALTISVFGWIFMAGLKKYSRFLQDTAARSFVVREVQGQLVKAAPMTPLKPTSGQPLQPTPLADLDRLYEQGMISKEEWERIKAEIEK